MSNGIKVRENEEHSIAMLAAQRTLYNDAKMAETLKICLAVWVPFALSFVLLFVSEDSAFGIASYSISILSVIFSYFVGKYIKKKKELAAAIQQQFDVYVYHMPWNDRLFGKKKNLSSAIVDYSKKLLSKENEKAKLKNWYPEVVDEKSLEEGIIVCQRENCWWDSGLKKRYKTLSLIFVIVLCVIVLVIGIAKNEVIVKLLWRAAFIAPMVQWLLETIDSLNEDIEELAELDDCINDRDTYQMEELQEIQKMIFEHRKNCFAIPNIVYRFFKDNDEDKAHRIARM